MEIQSHSPKLYYGFNREHNNLHDQEYTIQYMY